ncbi:outer membrane protein assembly factor BamB family protein [Streptomyces sp. NBC_00525]|uniref:outer membrane protein assembly factor BamB family protein n=1 Tax=Streptomyces sp. NBC_00525 TaxID=2903660 RepID=UPI002E7FECAD|nr:PQQ-binding-like beta-propeller repeat protein [Streptomyces sp. NBC_00525]WUC95973.1 PQQ-binding-like beta-propeller repeat protein [Streptomyces sp. NBC_00525]
MEAPRQDEPGRFGPYTVLARLRETATAVQYLAHGAGAQDLVVVTAARPELASLPAFRHRFDAETRLADRLAGGWVAPLLDTGEDERPWTATPYVPALTLDEAIGTSGPLPERAVRVLGAGLAETLARVHATGATLQGLSPRTVLLAADGPRLTAFGPLGAAAEAAGRDGRLSVRLGHLTPEQLAGEEAGPASDLFVLGLLLAYAATGATPLADGPPAEAAERIAQADPELGGVPEELRGLIARCLAKDPADRPDAGAVAAELALEGAAALAAAGWLPDRLAAAVAAQGAEARRSARGPEAQGPAHDAPAPQEPRTQAPAPEAVAGADVQDAVPAVPARQQPPAAPAPALDTRTTQLGVIGRPAAAQPVPAAPPASWPGSGAYPPAQLPPEPLPVPAPPAPAAGAPRSGLDRRALLVGGAAGLAGLLIGGGAVYATGSGDDAKAAPEPKPKPAPSSTRPTLAGTAPQPRWIHTHPEGEPAPLTAALWKDRLLVLTDEKRASAVDLRTGRRVWECQDGAGDRAALPADDEHCFVVGASGFLWISAKDGKVAERLAYEDGFEDLPGLTLATLVGADGSSIWFTGSHRVTVKAPKPKKGKKRGKDKKVVKSYLFAYDIAERKELWRSALPNGRGDAAPAYQLIAVREDAVVVRQRPASRTAKQVKAARNKSRFISYDRATGKAQWTKSLGRVTPDAAAVGGDDGVLYAAEGSGLRAFATPGGKARWTLEGGRDSVFGVPVPKGDTLYTTNRNHVVGALDRESGKAVWQRSTEAAGDGTPAITVSSTGKTLLAAERGQVTAFAAADGKRLWKFQDIGNQDPGGETVTAGYQVLAYEGTAVVRRGGTVYAFPVA